MSPNRRAPIFFFKIKIIPGQGKNLALLTQEWDKNENVGNNHFPFLKQISQFYDNY